MNAVAKMLQVCPIRWHH